MRKGKKNTLLYLSENIIKSDFVQNFFQDTHQNYTLFTM